MLGWPIPLTAGQWTATRGATLARIGELDGLRSRRPEGRGPRMAHDAGALAEGRIVMAQMLLDPPNVLVLDEPTNHLDLATKEMLVGALKDFEGTLLFVSHDRTFLKGLAIRVLELAPEAHEQPLKYPGTYLEYVEATGSEAPGVHS